MSTSDATRSTAQKALNAMNRRLGALQRKGRVSAEDLVRIADEGWERLNKLRKAAGLPPLPDPDEEDE